MEWRYWTVGRPGLSLVAVAEPEPAANEEVETVTGPDVPFDDLPDTSVVSLAPASARARVEPGGFSASELGWRRDNAMRAFGYARDRHPEASIALAEQAKAERKRFEEQQKQLQAGWNAWNK